MRVRMDVLVSWVSIKEGAAPLLTALGASGSPLRGSVGTVYLCFQDNDTPGGQASRKTLTETVRELEAELREACPQLEEVPWQSAATPVDHKAIREFAEATLRAVRLKHPACTIYIHLSSGTPAMHAVWLVLASTGCVEGAVKTFQTAPPDAQSKPSDAVTMTDLSVNSWLRQLHTSNPQPLDPIDDGHLWDPISAKSPARRRAMAQLERWAPMTAPVLLLGERGSGKTTVANLLRARHPGRKRQNKGWPVVVCGQFASNPQLARAELFGHAKGAFTGADEAREGLLERADGDTLFLDEIAHIDRGTQHLLMAAIEGRGFQRLGETKNRPCTFRLVSATNRTMEELRETHLDADFLDRIATFVLVVPPLRECREDLPDLWAGTLRRVANGCTPPSRGWERFAEHATLLDGLRSHRLPGNLRDLYRMAHHLVASLSAGADEASTVAEALSSLDSYFQGGGAGGRENHGAALPFDLEAHLQQEREHWLESALIQADGNKTKAAALLHLKRETFSSQLAASRRRITNDR